jgi:hypothetical protein
LIKEYSDKGKAVFIEASTFETTILLPDGKMTLIADTVNDTVKKRLIQIILQLQ